VKSGHILHTFNLSAAEYYISAQYDGLKSRDVKSGLCRLVQYIGYSRFTLFKMLSEAYF